MANTKSAKKSVKVNERRRVRNISVRSSVKTAIKKATDLLKKKGDATEAARAAFTTIDKAAVSGIIHKNTAARKKSRLAKKVNAATA